MIEIDNTVPHAMQGPLDYFQQYGYKLKKVLPSGELNDAALLSSDGRDGHDLAVLKVQKPTEPYSNHEIFALDYFNTRAEELAGNYGIIIPEPLFAGENFHLLSYVPGNVLDQNRINELSIENQAEFGAFLARFIVWSSRQLDCGEFVDACGGLTGDSGNPYGLGRSMFDWSARLSSGLSNGSLHYIKDYPPLIDIFMRMQDIMGRHYSRSLTERDYIPIHGDFRPPNTAGEWSGLQYASDLHMNGAFDFETSRLGDAAEEMRALRLFRYEAVDAANGVLDDAGLNSVYPEKIELWYESRRIIPIVYSLMLDRPQNALRGVNVFKSLYPDEDWSSCDRIADMALEQDGVTE